MGTGWRDSPEVLARLLREHGQDPSHVTSVEASWQAFRSFLASPVDGLEPDPQRDADGFIVQWGRYVWDDMRPSLTFTRQMAVNVKLKRTDLNDPRMPSSLDARHTWAFLGSPNPGHQAGGDVSPKA